MINALTGLGYGIIGFAVLIGIGIVILAVLGANIAQCPTGYTYNTYTGGTSTSNTCCLATATQCTGGANTTSASTGTQTVNSVVGYLGTSNGGLASWLPIIIVLVIGMLFLGAFLSKKGRTA